MILLSLKNCEKYYPFQYVQPANQFIREVMEKTDIFWRKDSTDSPKCFDFSLTWKSVGDPHGSSESYRPCDAIQQDVVGTTRFQI